MYTKEEKYIESSKVEQATEQTLGQLLADCPIPQKELVKHLRLFMGRMDVQDVLIFNDLYQKILGTHGVIMEFGTRYGDNLATLASLRGLHEPYVRSRKIIGFDTFKGFIKVDEKDGAKAAKGDLSTTEGYERFLDQILKSQEQLSPISQIQRYEIRKGDAVHQLKEYLEENPETIVAMAIFDLDLYEPTRDCLNVLKDYITKGSVIAFDQVCYPNFPGETLALKEAFPLKEYALERSPLSSSMSYIQIPR